MQTGYLQVVFTNKVKLRPVLSYNTVKPLTQTYTTEKQNKVTNIQTEILR